MKIMSRIKAMVLIDKNCNYDSNSRTGIICGIITMVYIEKNHNYDFKSGNHVWNHGYALY